MKILTIGVNTFYLPVYNDEILDNLTLHLTNLTKNITYTYPIVNESDSNSYLKFNIEIEDIEGGEYVYTVFGINCELKEKILYKGLSKMIKEKYKIINNNFEPKYN